MYLKAQCKHMLRIHEWPKLQIFRNASPLSIFYFSCLCPSCVCIMPWTISSKDCAHLYKLGEVLKPTNGAFLWELTLLKVKLAGTQRRALLVVMPKLWYFLYWEENGIGSTGFLKPVDNILVWTCFELN